MVDMTTTIQAKSDQLNADDLIGRSITITVTRVSLLSSEQPIAINYEGDNGKPYKPCKSMRRVMVFLWGDDGGAYVGRQMTLFRDEKVRFGADDVGGIRISHMSHIDEPRRVSLTASRGSKKPYIVNPLGDAKPKHTPEQLRAAAEKKANAIIRLVNDSRSMDDVDAVLNAESGSIKRLRDGYSTLAEDVDAAVVAKQESLAMGEAAS